MIEILPFDIDFISFDALLSDVEKLGTRFEGEIRSLTTEALQLASASL